MSLSSREVMKLSMEERERILEASAGAAEEEYRSNPDLTDFEAFGQEDLEIGTSERKGG
ncbi:MAG: hypothetical protein AB1641_03545 [Thermodesulfobacteriota bacterium]